MSYIEISYSDIGAAGICILIALALSLLERLQLEKTILIGAVRAFVQLTVIGYILKAVFDLEKWYYVTLMLLVMLAVAAHTAAQRQEQKIPYVLPIMIAAIAAGVLVSFSTVILVVLKVEKWYQPQYAVPIGGMIIGNAMNTCALAVERLASELRLRRPQIEAALSLGAPWRLAAQRSTRAAIRAALIPGLNAMMVIGVVQLPGMMTGQIIAGAEPVDAIRYQIVVAYMICGAAFVAATVAVYLASRQFFTPAHQLRAVH